MSWADVDIVIVSYNTAHLLERCLASIEAHASPVPVRTIVVDNASSDGSVSLVRNRLPEIILIENPRNLGFSAANNQGIAAGEAPFVLCMNSDAELTPGALTTLLACMREDAQCVIAGPRLQYPDGRFQPSCRRFPNWSRNAWMYSGLAQRLGRRFPQLQTWLDEEEHRTALKVDMVSGACFLARRTYLERIGGFDEQLFFYEEELDLSLPAQRAGQVILYCPEATVVHHGGASVVTTAMSDFAQRQLFRSKYIVFRKHYGPGYARLTHYTDALLFTVSLCLNTLRGRPQPPRALLCSARRAWRESFQDTKTLRDEQGFFR